MNTRGYRRCGTVWRLAVNILSLGPTLLSRSQCPLSLFGTAASLVALVLACGFAEASESQNFRLTAADFAGAALTGATSANFAAFGFIGSQAGASSSPNNGFRGGFAYAAFSQVVSPSALQVLTVSSYSASLAWDGASNPSSTTYILQAATGPFAVAPVAASSSVQGLQYALSGLNAYSTYYFRVSAYDWAFPGTNFVAGASTATMPPLPGQPGRPAGFALGISSISWSWAEGLGAQGYLLRLSTSLGTQVGSVSTAAFTLAGLSPNTTWSVTAAPFNITGEGTQSSSAAAVYTLANPPGAVSAAGVYAASAALAWGLNGNPSGTLAQVERSTDGSAFARVYSGAVVSLLDYGLLGCTSYYYRIRNLNGDGIPTVYNAALQFTTKGSTPSAPSALSAESLAGNRIKLSWTPSPSDLVTEYRLYYDAGAGTMTYVNLLAVFSSTVTEWTTGVLASSAAYRFALRAKNRCGSEERNTAVLAMAPSLSSLSGVKAAVKVPQTGRRVKGNRVTVMAELASGEVFQTRRVLFQYKPSTDTLWRDIVAANALHPNPDQDPPYFVHWDVTALTASNYDLRAAATDTQGNADPSPPAVTIAVDPADYDINETSLGGGRVQKEQKADNATANTVQAGDEGSKLLAKIEVPSGALDASTVAITVVNNPAVKPAPPSDAVDIGVVTRVDLSNAQSLLSGGKSAVVTLSYTDDDGDGIVDGTTARADRLRMYSAQTAAGPWLKDLSSSVDAARKTVAGTTPHFSFFAVFAAAAPDLSSVRVYPVPFMPNDGDNDNGVGYSPGDANSGIIFDNLPDAVTIKIYTVTGQSVASMSSQASGGKVQWDVKNGGGKDAASGLYFAVISSPGRSAVTKKIVVVR